MARAPLDPGPTEPPVATGIESEKEKLLRWADVLKDAFRLIFSRASLEHILDELARGSCQVPADFSAIRLLTPDRQALEYRALHHRDPAQADFLRAALQGRALAVDLGGTAQVMETGKS